MILFKLFLSTIIGNVLKIHSGPFLLKIKASFVLALSVSPAAYVIDRLMVWTYNNQDFIMFVTLAIVIDHILGSYYHAMVKCDFTWKKNITGVGVKIGLVVMIGILFEGLSTITKHDSFLQDYLIVVTRLSVFLYPAGSALMNCAEITNGAFPPIGWIKKIKKFNQDLTLPNKDENDVVN